MTSKCLWKERQQVKSFSHTVKILQPKFLDSTRDIEIEYNLFTTANKYKVMNALICRQCSINAFYQTIGKNAPRTGDGVLLNTAQSKQNILQIRLLVHRKINNMILGPRLCLETFFKETSKSKTLIFFLFEANFHLINFIFHLS